MLRRTNVSKLTGTIESHRDINSTALRSHEYSFSSGDVRLHHHSLSVLARCRLLWLDFDFLVLSLWLILLEPLGRVESRHRLSLCACLGGTRAPDHVCNTIILKYFPVDYCLRQRGKYFETSK